MSAAARAAARESLRRDGYGEIPPLEGVMVGLTYNLPVACGDEVNERRLRHGDLTSLSDGELASETVRVTLALAYGGLRQPWARTWLEDRLGRCRAQTAARRRR